MKATPEMIEAGFHASRMGSRECVEKVINAALAALPGEPVVGELEAQVAFTLSDASRLLRKQDVAGACPHPDDCFYFGDRVRCGPCAVKASAARGVKVDDTHSHLPEVCKLRRELRADKAEIERLLEAVDTVLNNAKRVDINSNGALNDIIGPWYMDQLRAAREALKGGDA